MCGPVFPGRIAIVLEYIGVQTVGVQMGVMIECGVKWASMEEFVRYISCVAGIMAFE